jgi:DNA-binding protein H-NS
MPTENGKTNMTDFMQKQFDISQELIRLMNREHEQRNRILESYEEQLADKDRQIAKLRSTIEALEVLVKK